MPPGEQREGNGLLEKGEYWEPAKPTSPISDRLSKMGLELTKPEFLRKPTSPLRNRKTAWLDGLRGFAAFLVYWHHHQLWAHGSHPVKNMNSIYENAFGYEGEYHIATFHFIRTFFTGGHLSVTIFFVISGYVLSAKPISLIHAGDHVKLSENLASALFRRWLRLFIPVIGTTIAYATSWHILQIWIGAHKRQGTYIEELATWYQEFKQWSFIFRQGGEPWFTYNFHSWSIPVEFRGSIVIFTALMAFSRCTKNARLTCQVLLIIYFMYVVDGWYCALFVAGMLLCDIDQLAERDEHPRWMKKLEPYKVFISYHLLALGLYLGGVPSQNFDINTLRKNYGWYYLSYLKPHAVYDYKWFFLFVASVSVVGSVSKINWLKKFFESRFCQYLGRISFSLYLCHGPVIWIVADRLYAAVGYWRDVHEENIPQWIGRFPLPRWGPLGLELNFLAANLILLPLTLWISEISTKVFDEPSLKFAHWVYKLTLPAPNKGWNPGGK